MQAIYFVKRKITFMSECVNGTSRAGPDSDRCLEIYKLYLEVYDL